MQGCQLQCLRAFYCLALCGQDCRIPIGTRDSHASASADSKYSRVYARNLIYADVRIAVRQEVVYGHP